VAEVEVDGQKRGINMIKELSQAWSRLPLEEKARFDQLAREDSERFSREFEDWRALQPEEALAEAYELARLSGFNFRRQRIARPEEGASGQSQHLSVPAEGTVGFILRGAERASLASEREDKRRKRGRPAGPETDDFDLMGGASLPSSEGHDASQSDRPMPHSAPASRKPDQSVDDLLGDLMLVEADAEPHEDYDDGGFGRPDTPSTGWSDATPQAMGAPRALGPQLCLDESGNLVLNQSSLSRDLGEEGVEDTGVVQESVSQYASAYRKGSACKWSPSETDMFYQALALYGTDLFLVQTFFRNKSAAQIKVKFAKELKKNPDYVEGVLTKQRQKLTKDTFEQLHGKIDTSKHFKPPPSPQPGDAVPEADGSIPEPQEEAEEAMPPPEPEYSAEDESLTTNRLMALFD